MNTPGHESQSLGAIARRRLLRDRNAVAGLVVIGIALVVALLGGLVRPDPTPWANRQVPGIKDQLPGFQVTMLAVAKGPIEKIEQVPPWKWLLFGGKEDFWDRYPVFQHRFEGDELVIEEFNGYNDLVAGQEHRFRLEKVIGEHGTGGDDMGYLQEIIEERYLHEQRFLLGTDSFGRDVLSRLMAGTVISLSVGLIAVLISLLIGIPLGALAGYFRAEAHSFKLFGRRFRWPVDDVIMWLVNVIWSIPTLLLVIAITLALGKGFVQVFIAVGLTMWVEVARIVRGEVIRTREMEYVEAAKALGYTHGRIIFRHILPNVMGPVIVISAANFATAILMEAGLSFLGIGAQLPMVSWGGMIRSYYPYITTELWHLALLPGVCIMLLTLAFMLVGNGLRDALDTRSIAAR